MAGSRDLRLFVAILLSPEWIDALTGAQAHLRDAGLPLRIVRPDGIHLTLHFLGATPEARLHKLDRALTRAASSIHSFEIQLGNPGVFGPKRNPRVVWVSADEPSGRLSRLHAAIGAELSSAWLAVETRPFRAHLTLARVRETLAPSDATRVWQAASALRLPPVRPVAVREVALMESHLLPAGARYDVRRRYPLLASGLAVESRG